MYNRKYTKDLLCRLAGDFILPTIPTGKNSKPVIFRLWNNFSAGNPGRKIFPAWKFPENFFFQTGKFRGLKNFKRRNFLSHKTGKPGCLRREAFPGPWKFSRKYFFIRENCAAWKISTAKISRNILFQNEKFPVVKNFICEKSREKLFSMPEIFGSKKFHALKSPAIRPWKPETCPHSREPFQGMGKPGSYRPPIPLFSGVGSQVFAKTGLGFYILKGFFRRGGWGQI